MTSLCFIVSCADVLFNLKYLSSALIIHFTWYVKSSSMLKVVFKNLKYIPHIGCNVGSRVYSLYFKIKVPVSVP